MLDYDLIKLSLIQQIEEGFGNNPDHSDFYQKGAKSRKEIEFENSSFVEKLLLAQHLVSSLEEQIISEVSEERDALEQDSKNTKIDEYLADQLCLDEIEQFRLASEEFSEILSGFSGVKLEICNDEDENRDEIVKNMMLQIEHNRYLAKYNHNNKNNDK